MNFQKMIDKTNQLVYNYTQRSKKLPKTVFGGNIMKKIPVLIMLILCVTFGSVYAAWIYTGQSVSSVDRTISHGMTTATTDGDVGIIEVINNTVDIAIDQTAPGNYLAKLSITGEITVRFTPNPGAPEDIVNNAIAVCATLYTKNAAENKYEDTEIYVSPEGSFVDLVWEKQDNGSFLATVNAGEIDSMLDLGGDFVLDTHAKYNTFHNLEENITLSLLFAKK